MILLSFFTLFIELVWSGCEEFSSYQVIEGERDCYVFSPEPINWLEGEIFCNELLYPTGHLVSFETPAEFKLIGDEVLGCAWTGMNKIINNDYKFTDGKSTNFAGNYLSGGDGDCVGFCTGGITRATCLDTDMVALCRVPKSPINNPWDNVDWNPEDKSFSCDFSLECPPTTKLCYGKSFDDQDACEGFDCVGFNECNCPEGYGGDCTQYNCFGKSNLDYGVCSNHGSCKKSDECECSDEIYTGDKCQYLKCYEYGDADPKVCSGNGLCKMVGESPKCDCFTGHSGGDCGVILCNGIAATDTENVCHGNGDCVNHKCVCKNGWGGEECTEPMCFGRIGENACGGFRGRCKEGGICSCETGYGGDECQLFSCFGVSGDDTKVCGGISRGRCVAPDFCHCEKGWSGHKCSHAACNGIEFNNNAVCNSRGTCSVSSHKCVCNDPSLYKGDFCEIAKCPGGQFSGNEVCSGNGYCYEHDKVVWYCQCDYGYTGEQCDTFTCAGIAKDDTEVCNGRGVCVGVDDCTCSDVSMYLGMNCETSICYGVFGSDPDVCSGHGQCIDFDQCSCLENYWGTKCEEFSCFGVARSSPSVCNGGTCVEDDVCLCDPNWTGDECKEFACGGYAKMEEKVCGGHGVCQDSHFCDCKDKYYGAYCDKPLCFEDYEPEETCNGHGDCVEIDTCHCEEKYGGERCEFRRCFGVISTNHTVCNGNGKCLEEGCSCNYKYVGSNCEEFVLGNDVLFALQGSIFGVLAGIIVLIFSINIMKKQIKFIFKKIARNGSENPEIVEEETLPFVENEGGYKVEEEIPDEEEQEKVFRKPSVVDIRSSELGTTTTTTSENDSGSTDSGSKINNSSLDKLIDDFL